MQRSSEMYLVGYFLSRCSERRKGRPSLPPELLGVQKWKQAYEAFHARLGQGRDRSSFANSLKAVRDAFDSWNDTSGRAGWKKTGEQSGAGPSGMVRQVRAEWEGRSSAELWEAVRPYLQGEAESN